MKENWTDWNVYTRDRCACVYCGLSGLNDFEVWRQLAIDHLVPVSRRGRNGEDNKVVACHRCNTMKGCFDPSKGLAPEIISAAVRSQLIAEVKRHLNLDDSEERRDFDMMMGEIRSVAVA